MLDRRAVGDRRLRPRHPGGDHVDLARGQHLLALCARGPPHADVRLDLVEAREGAVEIARVDLRGRHAVGHQRFLDGVERMLAQRAAARHLLDVPQIGPRRRGALALELVVAIGEHRRVDVGADAIRRHVRRRDRLHHRLGLEAVRLQVLLVAGGQDVDRRQADLGHVPGVGLGVDHALDLRHRLGRGLHADDLDAGLLGERLVEHGAVGLGVDAAIVAHDDALALRLRRGPDRRCGQGRHAHGGGLERRAARGVRGVLLRHVASWWLVSQWVTAVDVRGGSSRPGLKRLCGSSACLIERMSSSSTPDL